MYRSDRTENEDLVVIGEPKWRIKFDRISNTVVVRKRSKVLGIFL